MEALVLVYANSTFVLLLATFDKSFNLSQVIFPHLPDPELSQFKVSKHY